MWGVFCVLTEDERDGPRSYIKLTDRTVRAWKSTKKKGH